MSKGSSGTVTGSWGGWETVIERCYNRLVKFGFRLTGNFHDAQDIVQEAICRVLDSGQSPRIAGAAFSYLRKAVLRIYFDKLKKVRRQRFLSLDDEENASLSNSLVDEQAGEVVHNRLEEEELRQQLRAWLRRLNLNQRDEQLFTMFLEDMSCEEIADELGEDVRLIKFDLRALRAQVIYNLRTRIRLSNKKGS